MRTKTRFGLQVALLALPLASLACSPPPTGGAEAGAAAAAATPEQVCKRAGELAATAGEPAEVGAQIEKDCAARMADVQGSYAKAVACMDKAMDFRQFKTCELPLTTYKSMFAALAPSAEALCDHVVTLMVTELGDQVPQDQIPMIRDKCVADAKQNAEMQGDLFASQARCIMGKNTIAELRECETEGGPGGPGGQPRPGPPPGARPSGPPPGAPPGALAPPSGAPVPPAAPPAAPSGAKPEPAPAGAPEPGQPQPVQPPPAEPAAG